MEQFGSHWTYFHEILYLSIFRNFFEYMDVSLTSDKNITGSLHEDRYAYLAEFLE